MAVWMSAGDLLDSLAEMVGFRTGLALARDEIVAILNRESHYHYLQGIDDEATFRIDPVEIQEMLELLLYSLGRLEQRYEPLPFFDEYNTYKRDPKQLQMWLDVSRHLNEYVFRVLKSIPSNREIDWLPYLGEIEQRWGADGAEMGELAITSLMNHLYRSPQTNYTQSLWKETIELKSLFESESLDAQFGKFFDQRFIDYLFRNFDDIDRINWRKFEGLTAEYFERCGFIAKPGPGRNDDNVDVRVWPANSDIALPPLMIIQCKREARRVSKVVVKALYADILDERAQSGLIVTSTALSPGAKRVCEVRGYPIEAVEREPLRRWIEAMRHKGMYPKL
jgi:restriction system protein